MQAFLGQRGNSVGVSFLIRDVAIRVLLVQRMNREEFAVHRDGLIRQQSLQRFVKFLRCGDPGPIVISVSHWVLHISWANTANPVTTEEKGGSSRRRCRPNLATSRC